MMLLYDSVPELAHLLLCQLCAQSVNVTLQIGAAALDRVAREALLAQLALHSIARLKGQVVKFSHYSTYPLSKISK